MAGPWEEYQTKSTKVEDGPWAEYQTPDDPTEKNMRTERVQQFYKDTGKGALETGAALLSSMALAPIAGITGLGSLPAGLDKAVENMGKVFDLGYQPKTDIGKRGTESVTNVLNLPAEYAGKLGEAVAGNEGRLVGEIAGEFATDLLPFGLLTKGKMKPLKSKDVPKVEPKLDSIADRMDAAKTTTVTPEVPIVDTRKGTQLSREAYEAALREQQLQRESAFNRHENFPDLVQEGPMDRMVRDLGGEPLPKEAPRDTSPMGRMAEDLTTERSTPDQRAAQDAVEARRAELDAAVERVTEFEQDAVKRDQALRAIAEERAKLDEGPVYSPEHKAWIDEQTRIADEATRARQEAESAKQQQAAQESIEARQRALEEDVEAARLDDEAIKDTSNRRLGPTDTTTTRGMVSLKERPIGKRGPANKQTGAIMLPFGKRNGGLPEQIDAVQKQIDELGRRYVGGKVDFEEFSKTNHELIGKKIALEQTHRKYLQGVPAKDVEEVFPGYKIIPIGTVVMAKNGLKYPEPTRGTVVATHGFRYGDKAYNLPVVDFGDGSPRKILPSDISEVFAGPRDPFKGPGKNQAGAIRLPFGKKPAIDQLKKVAGIKQELRHVFPMEQTVPELITEHSAKKTPDIDQNSVQRLFNHLTKGSLYQAIKTDNPVIQKVGEAIRGATNRAMEATGRLVHNDLAPKARALSRKEKTDVWAVQQIAEAKGFDLTPEFLANEGFNQKQIDYAMTHKTVMDDMYTRLGDSMKAAGLKPVSPRVAYLASKARGDFRKLVMKDDKVVGILGANTRDGLNKQVDRLLKDHPEYKVGEERYYGGRKARGTEEGYTALLDFLAESDPNIKAFVEHVNEMLTQDAFNYMNAKTHTMQKKGVFGMEGRKLFNDAYENAVEGMQAQVRYAETMIKWSEYSKAIAEIKPLLRADNGLDMPMAKKWANEYIQGALGNSPGALGNALDNVTAALGKGTGLGTTIPGRVVSGTKQYINGLLLGWVNAGFLLANAVQAPRTMPEMATWLKTKGVDVGIDIGLGRATHTLGKELMGAKMTDLEAQAFDYAKKNHVYSSNLFETGNTVTKDLSYRWQKGTQFIASELEAVTRKGTFFAYVHMLDASGVRPKDGLFEAAQNLTDMHMNNYAQAEAPRVYQETGGIGRSAYNLMSFKHNELSRMAMLAREIPNNKEGRPILVAIASQIAFAGLIGTVGFAEADYLYEKITAMLGKPTSLTKQLLDNPEIPEQLKFGVGQMASLDMTSRLGIQVTPGSLIDLVAPGMSKIGDIAGAAGQAVSDPSAYNLANLARETLPLSVGGIMDRTIFETPDGMALNRNKVEASAVRNDADKLWKALGMTGINESVQKKLNYENQKIDRVYEDKRNKVIDAAIKEYHMRGVLPDNWLERYVELQGDPTQAKQAIKARIEALNVDRPTKDLMQNAASKSITSQHKALRRLGLE